MRTHALLAAGVFVGALMAAPVPKVKAKAKDEEAIIGTWQVERFNIDPDLDPSAEQLARMRDVFEKDGQMVQVSGSGKEMRVAYTLDPDVTPKAIDLKYPSCTFLGIYELEGDTLRLCIHQVKNSIRPTEFKPDAKTIQVLISLKRVKDE